MPRIRAGPPLPLPFPLPSGRNRCCIRCAILRPARPTQVCLIPGSSCGRPGHVRAAFANLKPELCKWVAGAACCLPCPAVLRTRCMPPDAWHEPLCMLECMLQPLAHSLMPAPPVPLFWGFLQRGGGPAQGWPAGACERRRWHASGARVPGGPRMRQSGNAAALRPMLCRRGGGALLASDPFSSCSVSVSLSRPTS